MCRRFTALDIESAIIVLQHSTRHRISAFEWQKRRDFKDILKLKMVSSLLLKKLLKVYFLYGTLVKNVRILPPMSYCIILAGDKLKYFLLNAFLECRGENVAVADYF